MIPASVQTRFIAKYGHIYSIVQIAEALGISTKTVRDIYNNIFRTINLRYEQPTAKVTDEELVAMYKSGLTQIEIAELVGCSRNWIVIRLKRSGVQMRSKGARMQITYQNTLGRVMSEDYCCGF